jgi:hypothetical protein
MGLQQAYYLDSQPRRSTSQGVGRLSMAAVNPVWGQVA